MRTASIVAAPRSVARGIAWMIAATVFGAFTVAHVSRSSEDMMICAPTFGAAVFDDHMVTDIVAPACAIDAWVGLRR